MEFNQYFGQKPSNHPSRRECETGTLSMTDINVWHFFFAFILPLSVSQTIEAALSNYPERPAREKRQSERERERERPARQEEAMKVLHD